MKLSVVIPAYNEEKYLPGTLEALRLALASIPDAEIIVVDNRSTDATRQIASSQGAKIVDEDEHNIGQVRNTGALAAAGEVLVFLDADTLVARVCSKRSSRRLRTRDALAGAWPSNTKRLAIDSFSCAGS